jgi:hypothetical protein
MFRFISYLYTTSGGPCPRGTSSTLFELPAPVVLPSIHVLPLLSSLSCTNIEIYGNHYLLLFLVLVLSLSLSCRFPASILSSCSGSDDTSPSSSLLPLPHCGVLVSGILGIAPSVPGNMYSSVDLGCCVADACVKRFVACISHPVRKASVTGSRFPSPYSSVTGTCRCSL